MMRREVAADGHTYTPADLLWKTLDISSMLTHLVYSYKFEDYGAFHDYATLIVETRIFYNLR